jgi:hypothetical protein
MSEGDIDFSPVPGGEAEGISTGERRPDGAAVESLLSAARAHPLGIEFLRNGYLGSVAATFRVHAFVVEEARRKIGLDEGKKKGDRDGLS